MKNFVFLLTTCALMTAGCEKKPAATAVDKEATTESKTGTLSKFQKKLVDTEITDWEPTSNSGAQFIYKTLGFNADGTWTASGVVKADFEEFECTESGTWTMVSETNATSGTIDWAVKETDCISREAGTSIRTLMDYSGGDYQISFR